MAHWTQKKPLSFRQRRAAKLLSVGCLNVSKVAQLVGVRRETIWARRQQPEFQARVEEFERESDQYTYYRRRAGLELALTTLEELVRSPNPRVSLAAMTMVVRLNGRLP
jgi:hypothetical protein